MKLIIDIDENVYTRLFDNGSEEISDEDRIQVEKAIRKGTLLECKIGCCINLNTNKDGG